MDKFKTIIEKPVRDSDSPIKFWFTADYTGSDKPGDLKSWKSQEFQIEYGLDIKTVVLQSDLQHFKCQIGANSGGNHTPGCYVNVWREINLNGEIIGEYPLELSYFERSPKPNLPDSPEEEYITGYVGGNFNIYTSTGPHGSYNYRLGYSENISGTDYVTKTYWGLRDSGVTDDGDVALLLVDDEYGYNMNIKEYLKFTNQEVAEGHTLEQSTFITMNRKYENKLEMKLLESGNCEKTLTHYRQDYVSGVEYNYNGYFQAGVNGRLSPRVISGSSFLNISFPADSYEDTSECSNPPHENYEGPTENVEYTRCQEMTNVSDSLILGGAVELPKIEDKSKTIVTTCPTLAEILTGDAKYFETNAKSNDEIWWENQISYFEPKSILPSSKFLPGEITKTGEIFDTKYKWYHDEDGNFQKEVSTTRRTAP